MRSCSPFCEKLVVTGLSASSSEKAIRVLGGLLLENGYVKDSFIDSVIEREKVFATGLPTQPFAAAIPHTDCEHVERTGVAVGVPTEPIDFGVMGTPGETVGVRLIFLMAMHAPEEQVKMLRSFVEMLRRRNVLEQLCIASSASEIVEILDKEIGIEQQ